MFVFFIELTILCIIIFTVVVSTNTTSISTIPIPNARGLPTVPLSLVDLGKRLLDASKRGDTMEIRNLMSGGAPFTTDWVNVIFKHY